MSEPELEQGLDLEPDEYNRAARGFPDWLAALAFQTIFPLGLVPQKRPPQVPKSFIKCRENTVFGGLVGAFFGEPT